MRDAYAAGIFDKRAGGDQTGDRQRIEFRDIGQKQAGCLAQAQHDFLDQHVLIGKCLATRDRMDATRDTITGPTSISMTLHLLLNIREPISDIGFHIGSVPAPTAVPVKRMRSGTETDIRQAFPVTAVVYGLITRQGEIGHLVLFIAGLGQHLLKQSILSGA